MSNGEAIEEVARAIEHIARAEQHARTDVSRTEVKNLKRQCYDVIDGLVNDIVADERTESRNSPSTS